jgi:hypothetical protein
VCHIPSSYGVSNDDEVMLTISTVDTKLVTVAKFVVAEGGTSGAGACVVKGVDGVAMVASRVVGTSWSVTTVVERIVSVFGGIVFGGSVMVSVESLVTICVLGVAVSSGWPPSTGTTEYGALLPTNCGSLRTAEKGNALEKRINVWTESKVDDTRSLIMMKVSCYYCLA